MDALKSCFTWQGDSFCKKIQNYNFFSHEGNEGVSKGYENNETVEKVVSILCGLKNTEMKVSKIDRN